MFDRLPNIPQVLNVAGLHKVLNKALHYRYLIGFRIRLNAMVIES